MRSNGMVIHAAGALLAASALACSDSTGAGSSAGVSLAFSTRAAPVAIAASYVGTGSLPRAQVVQDGEVTVVTLGEDVITLKSVELVLREIELKRSDVTQCSTTGEPNDHDGCEEFAVGIQLVSLPLGTALATKELQLTDVPPGSYDEVEFACAKRRAPSTESALQP